MAGSYFRFHDFVPEREVFVPFPSNFHTQAGFDEFFRQAKSHFDPLRDVVRCSRVEAHGVYYEAMRRPRESYAELDAQKIRKALDGGEQ